ncbi:MAG: hypothetical protein PHF21_02115 [Bacilli bacterium]|nr:hypothetical protein [Bacilli bacterium]
MKNNNWIYKVFLLTFILSIFFSGIANVITYNANIILTLILLILVISLGIIFDMIGTSVLTSKESSFHAMNSKKIKGAKEAISLLKNNAKTANLCMDVFGDIFGILSGGLGAVLTINIAAKTNISLPIISVIIGALISSLTVGGKAGFKNIAIKKSDFIVFTVGKLKHLFRFK